MTNLNMQKIAAEKHRGFTLIELLIVMVIISVVGGVALLSISHNQNTRYDNLAKQITNLLSLAEEEAMLKPVVLGLGFTDTSFQFYEYDDSKANAKEKTNPWQPASSNELGLHRIPDDVQLTVKIRNKVIPIGKDQLPQLIISTSGDIIPFTILIGKPGSEPRYQVVGLANGSLTSGPIEK
jgi:general secretion pathway protein H